MDNTSTCISSPKELFGFSLGDQKDKYEKRPFLSTPRGIALDEDAGIIYVCEMVEKSIHVFTMDGSHITTFGNTFFDLPWGILLYDGYLFVTDVGRSSLIMLRDCRMDEVNRETTHFKFCRGMSISSKTEELFIADEGRNRVVVCTIEPLCFKRVFARGVINPLM
ncbi:hypothetical protein LOD99_15598 [Oopsacas minuta]|uniref:Uncharacterized protein n=1 Tax=Oopsacas minuta TaxID=111878 RepID=A0AAV7KAZ5_9METZ|nr:hypothetical protein LOD99_15598 [Oopsacas minuta]